MASALINRPTCDAYLPFPPALPVLMINDHKDAHTHMHGILSLLHKGLFIDPIGVNACRKHCNLNVIGPDRLYLEMV